MKRVIRTIIACACILTLIAGCSQKAELKNFGTKSETAYELHITNKTGQSIKSLKIADDVTKEWSDNYLKEDVIGEDEEVIVFVEASCAKVEQKEDEKAINVLYLMFIQLEDGKEFELSDTNFDLISAFSVYVEDDIAYIAYEKDGKEVSTKESEFAIKEAKEQAKKEAEEKAKKEAEEKEAEEKAKKEAEEQAAAEQEALQQQPIYYETPTEYYDYPQGTTDSTGSSEGCLDGI